MYTIGRLSKATNVTIRTLRYYDELGILKPARVAETGYRYYDTSALMRLQQITALKHQGYIEPSAEDSCHRQTKKHS